MTTTDTTPRSDLRKLAEETDGKLRAIAGIVRTSAMAIGWYGRVMKEHHLFVMLGYDTEESYRDALGISEPTWYRNIQIAEGYKRVDRNTFMAMQPSKAYEGLDLPEDERIKPEWVKAAIDPQVSRAEFMERIRIQLETGQAHKDATSKEERGWFRVRMYVSAKEQVEGVLDDFCHEHGLGEDRGRALELLIVDANRFGAGVCKVVSDRLPELKATVELLKQASRPAEQRCAAFEKVASQFIIELAKASTLAGA